MAAQSKMDPEIFSMVLETLNKLERERLTLEAKLEMDRTGEFPMELIQFMLGPEIALHLIFIPEEYGGLGAGAAEIAVISERMAKMDLGVATSFLAICLGMDPIRVGATDEQKERWIRKIAEEGVIVAYGVTEPEAGSNVQALKTRADRVLDTDGQIMGYRLNGQKQFITNGGVASLYTLLASAPDGPSFFVVEGGMEGLYPGKHEDKHGIRASNTCPVSLDDLFVPAENLIGCVEGQGLKQANRVFGYTRVARPLLITDSDDHDVTDEILRIEDGRIFLNNTMMPAMITRDQLVMRQDCLCHLLQDYLPYHEPEY
jgi:alkylation response protein AidB-like acyl-CoA dehydrogenase